MKTILFITDLEAGSRTIELAGIRSIATKYHWHVAVIERTRLEGPLEDAVHYWSPQGCILEGRGRSFPECKALGSIPVVHLDPDDDTIDAPSSFTVTNDDTVIAELAVQELRRADCRAFAFVGWSGHSGWNGRRERTFCSVLQSLGMPYHLLEDPWTKGNHADFATRLIPFLKGLPHPCGIFAVNDDVAASILEVCHQQGYLVPGDFFVVGVDDDPAVCDNMHPSLSSIRPNFAQAGRLSARLLLRRIANPAMSSTKLLYTPLGVTSRLSTRRIHPTKLSIMTALDYIRREACSGIKSADVVRSLGLSERNAELAFKATTGKRITEEITDVRFERVFALLHNPRISISAIANLCGWESESYLKRLFKARTGMTMREWRSHHTEL